MEKQILINKKNVFCCIICGNIFINKGKSQKKAKKEKQLRKLRERETIIDKLLGVEKRKSRKITVITTI